MLGVVTAPFGKGLASAAAYRRRGGYLAVVALPLLAVAPSAHAQTPFTATLRPLADEKAVFATVESQNVVPARARIGGTVVALEVRDGDEVRQGQTIALVGDGKLQLQMRAFDAQLAGLKSSLQQAQLELARQETLGRTGATSQQSIERARTEFSVASNALAARTAERAVIEQQLSEGAVLAPISGRVLQVPVTRGSVILPGEPVARIAEGNYVLRLSVPERHAQNLHVGDKVRLDQMPPGSGAVFGAVSLVYPQIADGRVLADATVPGLGGYFVGQRVRVWIDAGQRPAVVIPGHLIVSRFGLDYVRRNDGIEFPVQRGRDTPSAELPDGVEILSGLQGGETLAAP